MSDIQQKIIANIETKCIPSCLKKYSLNIQKGEEIGTDKYSELDIVKGNLILQAKGNNSFISNFVTFDNITFLSDKT